MPDKTLIIFAFKADVDSFVASWSAGELKDTNTCVLALFPGAQARLKDYGIDFHTTYQFFGKEGHEHALLKSDEIYKFCDANLRIEDDLGIRDGYKITLLHNTRAFVHYILWLTETIKRACARFGVKKIISYRRDGSSVASPFLPHNGEHVADISQRIAVQLGIDYEILEGSNRRRNLFFERNRRRFYEVVKFLAYHVKTRLYRLRHKSSRIILAPSKVRNLDKVLDEFRQRFNGVQIIYMGVAGRSFLEKIYSSEEASSILQLPSLISSKKSRGFLEILNRIVPVISSLKDSDKIFSYKGIFFKDIVLKKVEKDFIPALRNTYGQSVYLSSFLRKCRPSLIVSQLGRNINYNLGELASLYNIPSLLISHGSHVPPKNRYEMIEWKEHSLGLLNTLYHYVAVQSPWAKAYLRQIPSQSTQIITGPLLFTRIEADRGRKSEFRKKLIPSCGDKMILLHADTPKPVSMRFYVYQTVDEYIAQINSLIRAVEKLKNFYLVVRFRPQYFLSEEEFRSLLIESDCYSIHSGGTFDEYLSVADMLVSYSSTTIEEALQNRVPVLLYDTQGRYSHIPCSELSPSEKPGISACYYVGSEDNLGWALKWLEENHFKGGKVSDSEWNKHVFSCSEVVKITSYFSDCFQNVGRA